MRPPPRAAALLRALLPEEERDYVMGDLEEGFRRRAEGSGRARATVWYWTEVARAAWPMLTYPGRWRGWTMAGLRQDLRGALRVFRHAPGFAAVVVLTLGMGVGGAAAVYSVVRGIVLTPMPFEDPDRVVMLWGQTPEYPRTPLTVGDHNELVNHVDAFSHVTAAWGNNALLLGEYEPEQVSVGWVTPEYFDVLGVAPALGRGLEPADEAAILISDALWVRRYGADPQVIGRVVDLAGASMEIIGVLPTDRDPNLTTFGGSRSDYQVWRLQPPGWTQGDDRSVGWLRSTARLRAGVTLAQAQAEVDALFERVNPTIADRDGGTDLRVNLVPVRSDLVGDVSRTLWILLGAVCGVLLIAATNVANLMLARGEMRAGEIAVRTALGGSRIRLFRQLLAEGGVLAAAGGALGLMLAWVGVDVLLAIAPPNLPRLETVRLDWGVFWFATAATALAALVFAVLPTVRATRADVSTTLGERQGTADPRRQRLSRSLVVAEVALSLALLTATGLLLRSFAGLTRVDLGFETEGIVTFALEAPDKGNSAEEAGTALRSYADRLEAMPGVRAAGFTNRVPLAGGLFTGTYRSDEMHASETDGAEASFRYVSQGYIEALGARLVSGRNFRPEDGTDRVLLDQLAAERLWPGENAVGRRVHLSIIGEGEIAGEVIGVIAPMKHAGVALPAAPTVFVHMLARAHQQNFIYMAVRVAGDAATYVEPMRSAVREVHPNAVIAGARTMQRLFDEDVAATRFAALLLSVFGGIAVLLAAVGLHGVIAFSVRRRNREIGIRVALGAEHGRILRSAVQSGAFLVLTGIAVGTVLALGLGQVLSSLLYEVDPSDAVTLVGSATLMLAVGTLSAYLPARLVLGVDPAVTLREE